MARGYAAAATDTGHKGTGIDASWALGHPEKIVDFGHRAIHEMTVAAKGVVEAFYGAAPRRSYFASCSNGGRQALMEARGERTESRSAAASRRARRRGRAGGDARTFDFDHDFKVVQEKMAKVLDATDPDLDPFQRRGGRLILFHGWNDPALPAGNTIDYVEAVRARLGAGVADSFLRLYMVPGQQHCGGGPGASYCGGLNAAAGDAQHDLSTALERWVEEGVAPGTMIAVKPSDWSNPAAASALMTRPLCPYPQAAVFRGAGSPDDPTAYRCEEP